MRSKLFMMPTQTFTPLQIGLEKYISNAKQVMDAAT